MSEHGFNSPRPYPPWATTVHFWFSRAERERKWVLASAKRKATR